MTQLPCSTEPRERLTRALRPLAASGLLLLGACSIGPAARDPPATYDFGPPAATVAANPGIKATLLLPGVAAPAWLDHSGIAYRLGYADVTRHQVYANSRWMAAPAALLTQRLRSRFAAVATGVVAGGEGVRADYALHVELEDFSQFFTTPEASHVAVTARASLVRLSDRALRAQRSFTVERPAAPDAAGAATALAQASDVLIGELVGWTEKTLGGEQRRDERSAK